MTSFRMTALLLGVSAALHTANAADLTVEVTSATEAGSVRIALYDSPNSFSNNAVAAGAFATPKNGAARFKIPDLAPGRYAVSAFLDTNNNQKLDTNSLGIPQEPFGMSRGAKGTFGPPSFEDASFQISETDLSIAIQLKK